MNDRLGWLLNEACDRELTRGEYEELCWMLQDDPKARERYYEMKLLDSELISSFSKDEVVAVVDALGSDESLRTESSKRLWSGEWNWRAPAFLFVASFLVLALIIAFGAINRGLLGPVHASSNAVPYAAWLVRSDNTVWRGSRSPLEGHAMVAQQYELLAGTAELKMLNDAAIAVRGPARFRIASVNNLAIEEGAMTIDDTRERVGMELEIGGWFISGTGARFAVSVHEGTFFEIHVLDGSVHCSKSKERGGSQFVRVINASQAVKVDLLSGEQKLVPYSQNSFPLPWRTEKIHIVDGDFEDGVMVWAEPNGEPSRQFDQWSGDYCVKSTASQNIVPKSGSMMMQFVSGMRQDTAPEYMGQASERYYWIDLAEYRKRWADRALSAELSVWFNRVPRSGPGKCEAKVILAAYREQTTLGLEAWNQRLVQGAPMQAINNSETLLMLDEEPGTWESVSTKMVLPQECGILLLSIRAQNERESFPLHFEDVFADLVEMQLHVGDPIATSGVTP